MSSVDTNGSVNAGGIPPRPEGIDMSETAIVPLSEVQASEAAPGEAAPGEAAISLAENGLAPVSMAQRSQNIAVWLGFVGCVLAGLLAPSTAIASSALIGYSTLLLSVMRGTRTAAAAAGMACVAALGASFLAGSEVLPLELFPSAVLTIVVGAAIGMGQGTGRLTSSMACIVCIVATLAYLGIDSALAALAGTDLNSLVMSQIDTALSALTQGASALDSSVELARTVASLIWPSSYTLNAIVWIVAAALGARIARRGLGPLAPRALTFTLFDLPIWVAGALLASIVGFAIAQVIPQRDALLLVVVNLAMAVRFAFGVSGIAVAAYFMRRRGMGLVITLVICGVLVFIDMQVFVMAIVGLIDFWANFRHLPRGAEAAQTTV